MKLVSAILISERSVPIGTLQTVVSLVAVRVSWLGEYHDQLDFCGVSGCAVKAPGYVTLNGIPAHLTAGQVELRAFVCGFKDSEYLAARA